MSKWFVMRFVRSFIHRCWDKNSYIRGYFLGRCLYQILVLVDVVLLAILLHWLKHAFPLRSDFRSDAWCCNNLACTTCMVETCFWTVENTSQHFLASVGVQLWLLIWETFISIEFIWCSQARELFFNLCFKVLVQSRFGLFLF